MIFAFAGISYRHGNDQKAKGLETRTLLKAHNTNRNKNKQTKKEHKMCVIYVIDYYCEHPYHLDNSESRIVKCVAMERASTKAHPVHCGENAPNPIEYVHIPSDNICPRCSDLMWSIELQHVMACILCQAGEPVPDFEPLPESIVRRWVRWRRDLEHWNRAWKRLRARVDGSEGGEIGNTEPETDSTGLTLEMVTFGVIYEMV